MDPDALDFWKTIGLSDSLQHFAFRDSPIVNEDMLAIWFEELSFGVAYNTTEWFEQLSIPSATDVNQPVAFSIENEFEAIGYAYDRAELANLATGAYIEGIQLGLPTYGVWSSSLDDEDPFNNDPIPSTCSSYYF
ncbi:MAG: hypothetical protein JKY37_04050 [Nannocystaceae bacterium]|nr:hypothetical protein [Nannocystaceae bacterium]